jgi:hypothetical protein
MKRPGTAIGASDTAAITVLFHSDLHDIPDIGVGFFVSYNSAGKGGIGDRAMLFHGFLDRYYPYTPPAGQIVAGTCDDAAGRGRNRRGRRRRHQLGNIQEPNGEPLKFEEIAPYLYRERHGQSKVGVRKDASGNWQFQMDYPFFIFQKAGFFESKYFVYAVLTFGIGVVLLTVLLWPVAAMARKHYGKKLDLPPADLRLRFWVRMVCLLFLALLAGWAVALSMADDFAVLNGLAPLIVLFGILAIVCTLGMVLVCYNAFRCCGVNGRWIWTKLHDLSLALACVGLVWFLFTWNLMNFRLHF